jgi:hypothetical protein
MSNRRVRPEVSVLDTSVDFAIVPLLRAGRIATGDTLTIRSRIVRIAIVPHRSLSWT